MATAVVVEMDETKVAVGLLAAFVPATEAEVDDAATKVDRDDEVEVTPLRPEI